jgi:hypothetical protein
MIQQLVQRLVANGATPQKAAANVLGSDPMDLILHMEQVWDAANLWQAPPPGPAGGAVRQLWGFGQFAPNAPTANPAWDHLGYAFVLENTRAVQILRRVVREFRSGEGLGMPSVSTQRWLGTTEALLFGGANIFGTGLSTSAVRPDPEGVRRNAYWRLFGMDLAFGTDENKPFGYDKAAAANTTFVGLFEELLYELWQAMSNIRNSSGPNSADDDRIFRIAEQLTYILRVRRQYQALSREELSAVTALGWVDLTLSTNTPVVTDMRAQATSSADRLKIMGERVGLAPHSRASSFFAMAEDLSMLLRTLEAGYVSGPQYAWLLYAAGAPSGAPPLPAGAQPLSAESRRVITEWSAATGRDLKTRKLPVRVESRQPSISR